MIVSGGNVIVRCVVASGGVNVASGRVEVTWGKIDVACGSVTEMLSVIVWMTVEKIRDVRTCVEAGAYEVGPGGPNSVVVNSNVDPSVEVTRAIAKRQKEGLAGVTIRVQG